MKALVVDDNVQNRMLLKIILEYDGFEVHEAENGLDSVDLFKEVNPDIVLMDVMMPVMDGYEATRLIKDYSGERFVPVIILTALNEPEDVSRAIKCGADDFITKPIHAMVLKSKIFAMERLRQLYNNLNLQKTELELLNNKMRQEHDAAANLFQKVLKLNEQRYTNVKQIVVPMETFSGDIVFSRANSSGGQYLLIGDFAGHGLLAAIGTLPVSEVFNSMADKNRPISSFVFEINRKLKELLPPSVFLCAAIIEFSSSERSMTVWSGGMPDILVVDKNGGIKQRIKSRNLPLGVLKSERLKCELQTLTLEPDDDVYIFSDGVAETFNGNNEMYGQERLEEHFRKNPAVAHDGKYLDSAKCKDSENGQYEPDTILDKIWQSLEQFRGELDQRDDITMVQIRCGLDSACYLNG